MPKIDIKINKVYMPYLETKTKFNIFYGGAGSGKSYFLATKLIMDLLKKPKRTLMVVRQTYASHRDTTFDLINQVLEKMELKGKCKISQTTLTITLPNDSKIIFKGLDDEEKLKSLSGVDLCWVEEANEISYEAWSQLKIRLRGSDSDNLFFLSFNPVSELSWLKMEFFDQKIDNCTVLHTTYLQNAFLDQEYIDTLLDMKERNPHYYEIYALGKWGTVGQRVYSNWRKQHFVPELLVQQNKKLVSAFGMDFGYKADPSTLVCTLVDLEQRRIYIFDEMYEKGLLNNQIAKKVTSMGYAKEKIIADSAEQKSIAELKQYGLSRVEPARKGSDSIKQGVQFIQQFEIIVHPNCKNTIFELENYSYKKDKATGKYTNTPQDANNHILDALRYALETYSKNMKKAKFLPKSLFGF